MENTAQEFLRDYPGVEAVYTRTQMEQGMMPATKLAKQVILAWHQKISGDIVIMNKPNWYLFGRPNTYASTHGSPWSYDTNVPLAMYGPNWIKPGCMIPKSWTLGAQSLSFSTFAPQRLRGVFCRRRCADRRSIWADAWLIAAQRPAGSARAPGLRICPMLQSTSSISLNCERGDDPIRGWWIEIAPIHLTRAIRFDIV